MVEWWLWLVCMDLGVQIAVLGGGKDERDGLDMGYCYCYLHDRAQSIVFGLQHYLSSRILHSQS